jgi:7,8-dihydro-6-hydroxymethylpterin dimethyltransferase
MHTESTESLCPVCLKRIEAQRVATGERVELVKSCPHHGEFRTIVWSGRPGMRQWQRPKTPALLRPVQRESQHGCPFDCGLCREHRQRSCTVLIEVTRRCNLRCPVCFADAGSEEKHDPGLEDIRLGFRRVTALAPGSNIQLSGGEPTVRDDLPAVVAAGREEGFTFIQLNTNGIRLAEDPGFVAALKDAGLSSVFLQFDGIDDTVYLRLRGRKLAEIKLRAINACAALGIGVVLVPTLVPGVNTQHIGAILQLATGLSPAVRGVHFQPISYFGRYPQPVEPAARITLPELMAAIEDQSVGTFTMADFRPPGCENAWCSFHADYLSLPGGKVRLLRPSEPGPGGGAPIPAEEGAQRAMAHVSRQWAGPRADPMVPPAAVGPKRAAPMVSQGDRMRLEDFLVRARSHTFTVSAMAFQDAWTLDLERVRDCCIHVLDPQRGLVPFCAYNVTAVDGKALYRR